MMNESVLFAMNDIDGEFLEEARVYAPKRRRRRMMLLVAALISLLIATACATNEITGWIGSFFSHRSESDLSDKQIQYIEDNEQLVSDTQKHNGYAVELKSHLATDNTLYVIFGITAPRNVDLVSYQHRVNLEAEWVNIYSSGGAVVANRHMDDGDGQSNTINYICILQLPHNFKSQNKEWPVIISSIHIVEDSGQTILAEGNWNYIIDLSTADTETVELLTAPIQTLAIVPKPNLPDDTYAETVDYVTVTSILLSPLDAVISYVPLSNEHSATFADTIAHNFNAYAVMKDGRSIPLNYGIPSTQGQARLLAESPIVLSEVDHVLLADGTKLMVP